MQSEFKLTVPEQKQAITDMEQKTLEKLYAERPYTAG